MDYDENALQTVRETRFLIDRYDDWLVREFRPYLGNRIIEIGCGLGNLFSKLKDYDLLVGIDNSNESISDVKSRYSKNPKIKVYNKSIIDPDVESLSELEINTAISLNVFEHIDQDELAVQNTRKLLQPRGIFILIVPAHNFLYGTMDKSIGHYRRYSKGSMKILLEKNGFSIVRQKYINMVGAMGWFVNGRILKKTVPPTGQLKYLNKLIPLFEGVENLFFPPFGVSLLTVAQKSNDFKP